MPLPLTTWRTDSTAGKVPGGDEAAVVREIDPGLAHMRLEDLVVEALEAQLALEERIAHLELADRQVDREPKRLLNCSQASSSPATSPFSMMK